MSERDLAKLLSSLKVTRRGDRWCMVSGVTLPSNVRVAATIVEDEGVTSVISVEEAEREGFDPTLSMAWLTIGASSALDAVGLTAAFATALARAGIACNVLAGYHHDHLLVPVDRAEQAIEILLALGEDSR
jgi:hypothetical protein